jgi:(R,R)-butanediol dehydrogenase / meso-butanediol dehydrogenase / diacetyl reductase
MLAAQYLGPNRINPVEIPKPAPEPEEALIKVEACGMCGSDLGIFSGLHPRARAPLTLGHEFCGRVLEIHSPTTHVKVGDRVAGYPLISCGHCLMCRTGNPHVCRTLRLYGIDAAGGMADFVKLPINNLIPLARQLDPQLGALVEPLAVAVHGVSRAPIKDARTIAVIGAGPIGLLTALVARFRVTAQVLIADVLASRISLARSLGFMTASAGQEMMELVRDTTGGEGADVVFECAGVPASAVSMMQLARCRGTIVNLGVFKKPAEVDLQTLNFKEITLMGARVYTREDFIEAAELAPMLPLRSIVTNTFPLSEVTAAFEKFRTGEGVCKVMIRP